MLSSVEKETVHYCRLYIACLYFNVAFYCLRSVDFTQLH